MHGEIFIVEISSLRCVNTERSESVAFVPTMTFSQFILKLTPTSPRRPQLGELKAMMFPVLTFFERLPRMRRLPKKIMTSGIRYWLAIKSDPRKLSKASFFNSRIGI